MASANSTTALPSAMQGTLRSIRRRQIALSIGRALAYGVAVLLAAIVFAMALDWWLTLFNPIVRVGLTGTALLLAVAALLITAGQGLRSALGWTQAASDADSEVPQLEERWTTVASFAVSNNRPTSPTARAMLEQVTSEAIALGPLVRPAEVARPASLKRSLQAMAGSTVLLAGFLALNWGQTSVLWQRFWSPTENITATQLRSLTGDVVVPRGELVTLRVIQSGLHRAWGELSIVGNDEIVDQFDIASEDDQEGGFLHEMRVDRSFRYRVTAGDGKTSWHQVTAIDYPELAEVRLTVTPPDYVRRPAYEKSVLPSRVKVVQGSRLVLLMKPLSPPRQFELRLSEAKPGEEAHRRTLRIHPDQDGWYRFETQLVEDLALSPHLINEHGLTNEDRSVCRLQVVKDKAPVARIVSPNEEMAVAYDDVLDIQFEAHDDHGIATAELVIYDESAEGEEPTILAVQEIPLGDQQFDRHVTGQTQLDLNELGVEQGTSISYAIRVTDNRDVTLASTAEPSGMQDGSAKAGDQDPSDMLLADAAEGPRGDAAPDMELARAMLSDPTDSNAPKTEHDPMTGSASTNSRDDNSAPMGETSLANDGAREGTPAEDGQPRSTDDIPQQQAGEAGSNAKSLASRQETASAATGDARADSPEDGTPATGDSSKGPGEKTEQDARPSDEPDVEGPMNDAKLATSDSGVTDPESSDAMPSEAPDGTPSGETPSENQPGSQAAGLASTDPNSSGDETKRELAEVAETNVAMSESEQDDNRTLGGAGTPTSDSSSRSSTEWGKTPELAMTMNPQAATSGQNSETGRRNLRITDRLVAVARSSERHSHTLAVRERVVEIDRMLALAEEALTRVVDRKIADADRSEQFRQLDTQFGDVETEIAKLREETRDEQFAFVGLQMVHVGTTHVTPARDRVFAGIREPLGKENPSVALRHVVRAREVLAALLKRYDRVARDQRLAEAIDESVEMYEVYVEKMRQLMREAREVRNPLSRKMAVIEVDQSYLDRFAEVEMLRREMMTEFGRMLGDDPRLLARYLDLLRRRGRSLRDRLTELADRQDEIASEVSGWLQVDESQRGVLWSVVAELRLHAATPLAQEADGLLERIEQSMPLVLTEGDPTATLVIERARLVSQAAREITFDVRKTLQQSGSTTEWPQFSRRAEALVYQLEELDAALDQLNFDHDEIDEVETYVTSRLQESRVVADQADAWATLARHLERQQYQGLAEIDQHQLAITTELLRIEMLGIEDDLQGQFDQVAEADLPGEIADMIRLLHRTMEAVGFHQSAATFALRMNRLEEASNQQMLTLEALDRAEDMFDEIRRAVVDELDQYEPDDPDIAALEDPTLDRFLAQLEREPSIQAQLGIPNRPRNLRVLADSMLFKRNGGGVLGASGDAARRRAEQEMKKQPRRVAMRSEQEKPESELTKEERAERERAREMQETLEKSLASLEEKLNDPQTTAEQRRRLEQMKANMERLLAQSGASSSALEEWERIVESDRASALLRSLAQGERLPDEQWNKLLSTLDDGLWQVRGRLAPEDYRRSIERYQERLREVLSTGGVPN